MIPVTPTIQLDPRELDESFVRASGPGGQNVNKLSTAVQLRFDVLNSPSLPADVRQRLIHLAGSRLTQDGILIIHAQNFRTQERNREDALARLVALIQAAAIRPKTRRATRPSKGAKERRLAAKSQRSGVKSMRRRPAEHD
ncbi:MAG TPA: alternative ribosome rescue aminoacyl-tRNA hydrolase ArfB [Geminicoccus sp.]|uniref:alternative ribosome rescue aminoacyl-tRNA hydrolase ArfB n=1 Tax=Geminicoccus sp. TaxID=2024832 RepID=UPI002D17D4A4|nr:alternative ribosome rescue aminoacyl-tRNA hydrolase ArfB [Geminicoccus sp.]HWL71145.1 alternative ribosome rescue aminoacyl-tRNA hydrolase ArfB [Geminicoccus sp.]